MTQSRLELTDDRPPDVGPDSHGDHVLLDELTQMDAGVESCADEIDPSLLGRGQVDLDVRVVAGELAELRRQHHSGRET